MRSASQITGGLRRRLVKGLTATALGPVITAAIQLGAVPLLIHAWGAAKYGEWLILSAIPTYLNLSDLGFGDASGSDMTVRVAMGDRLGALCTFQSSWVLLTLVSAAILLSVSLTVWWFPWTLWLHLAQLSNHEVCVIFLLFGAYMLAGQQTGVLESGFRCDGNYSTGTLYGNLLRLMETTCAIYTGVVTGSFAAMAFTYLIVRCAGNVLYGVFLRRKSPWLSVGVKHASLDRIKLLARPALGFVVLPAGHAVSLQGFPLLIGILLGPLAVAIFSTLRTLTRVNLQFLSIISLTIWPELSAAFGAGDLSLARALHRHAFRIGIAASLLTTTLLWIGGPFLYKIWMRGVLRFDTRCFHILLLVTMLNALWNLSSAVPMSTNVHHRIAFIYLGLAIASLGFALLLVRSMGVSGAAFALLLVDGGMCVLVLRTALIQLEDRFSDFLRGLADASFLYRLRRIPVVDVPGAEAESRFGS